MRLLFVFPSPQNQHHAVCVAFPSTTFSGPWKPAPEHGPLLCSPGAAGGCPRGGGRGSIAGVSVLYLLCRPLFLLSRVCLFSLPR